MDFEKAENSKFQINIEELSIFGLKLNFELKLNLKPFKIKKHVGNAF
jgi:hypothetical protein